MPNLRRITRKAWHLSRNAAENTIPCNCYALTLLEGQPHHLHLLGRHCLAFPHTQVDGEICPVAPTGAVLVEQVGKGQLRCSPIIHQHKWPSSLPALHTHQDWTTLITRVKHLLSEIARKSDRPKCRFPCTSHDKPHRKFKKPFWPQGTHWKIFQVELWTAVQVLLSRRNYALWRQKVSCQNAG